jgi:DNA mismatch endonuclease (patch repair protein)
MIVRRLVHGMGYRYRLHVAVLPGKPDLVFIRLKKIIEVQGCFWHQHPGCTDSHIPRTRIEYWGPKLVKNQQRDADNQAKLKALGWKVLTVWECQLADQPKVQKRLNKFLSTGRLMAS